MTDRELEKFLEQYMKDSEKPIDLYLVPEEEMYRMMDDIDQGNTLIRTDQEKKDKI